MDPLAHLPAPGRARVLVDGLDHPEGVAYDPVEDVVWAGGEDGQLYRVRDGGFEGPHNGAVTWRHLLTNTSEWEGELFGKSDRVDRGRDLAAEGQGRKGTLRPLRARPVTLRVRRPDGSLASRTFTTWHSHHGPIVRADGERWIAMALTMGLSPPWTKPISRSPSSTRARKVFASAVAKPAARGS